MRQFRLKPGPNGFLIQVAADNIVGAQEYLLAIPFKVPDCGVLNPRNPAHSCLNLTGLHPVAIDLHHRFQATGYHDVSIRQAFADIPGMEYAVSKHTGCFFRQVDVSPEERIVETDFPGLPVGHFLVFFIQQTDADVLKHRFSDRGNVVFPVYLKLCNVEPGFTHALIINEPHALKPHAVGRLAAGDQRLQAGGHTLGHDSQNGW